MSTADARRRALRRLCALSAALSACGIGLAGAARPIPARGWLTYNNRLDGQRFSPLAQITPANVARLREVCRVRIDGPGTLEAGLVVRDGVIYVDTARKTLALDATDCAVRWQTAYEPESTHFAPSVRGVAVMDGRVFRGTGDARLVALDAATGKRVWEDVIGSPQLGESASGAPLAWNGVVYIGIAGSELGVRGRVMAFDAATGRELWRFSTVPTGRQVGADSWKRAGTAKTGGGGIWGAMSVDVDSGELFVPVGNPWPDIDNRARPGRNLFTDSMVVLDARTGALKWWYQATANDWRDMDLAAAPVLYRDRGARDIMAFAGKDGYITAVDRDTHRLVFRTPVTTIGTAYPAATPKGVHDCPGYAGGVEWNGPALDPINHTLVTGSVDACFDVTLGTAKYQPGKVNFGGTVRPDGPVTGWVTAVDSETGRVRWRYHDAKPVIAGVTPTAGGITITGDLAGDLLIFDSRTGRLLREIATGGALAGGVVTYAVAGRQYVAFATGNVAASAFGSLGVPSIEIISLGRGRGADPGTRKPGSATAVP